MVMQRLGLSSRRHVEVRGFSSDHTKLVKRRRCGGRAGWALDQYKTASMSKLRNAKKDEEEK
jgi:hypothetical protein